MADTALLATYLSLGAAAVSLGAWWALAAPRLALAALVASLAFGQLIRIPVLGQAGGLLLSDIAVSFVLLAALVRYVWSKQIVSGDKYHVSSTGLDTYFLLLTTPFIIWSLFGLAIQMPALGLEAAATSLAYWMRLTVHLLLLPALVFLFQDDQLRLFGQRAWLGVIFVLLVLGGLQLGIFPNVAQLPTFIQGAWDPHMGRLVASWLDPNFIGIFFVVAALYLGARRQWLWLAGTLLALVLTQSRSSLGALLITVIGMSPLVVMHVLARTSQHTKRAVQMIVFGVLTLAVGAIGVLALGERFPAAFVDDPNVTLRLAALEQTWRSLGPPSALLGQGYNTYQYAAAREGLIESFTVHSRAGSDNSLLNLWITTGVVGIILFALPWAYAAGVAWYRAWHTRSLVFLAAPAALIALLAHAQVVNSLLYSHLLIALTVVVGLTLTAKPAGHG